ncbi:ccd4,nced4 [Orobanche minor]
MRTLSPSLHARNTHLLRIPPFRIINVQPLMTAKKYSFFTTFHPIKKLCKNTTQAFDQTPITVPRVIPPFKNQPFHVNHILNTLDDFICTFLDLPFSPSINPERVRSGNFAPVDELPPTACTEVEGSLPPCLAGAYIRNGPNPQFIPKGPSHFLDGDGMLHVIKISKGEATFSSSYVKTHKYETEREVGLYCRGRKQKEVPIHSMEKCAVIHDFAVTENYAVFCDGQIVVNPLRVLSGRSPVGVDPGKIPRLGIIRKYAADESGMRWVDAPGFNMLHCVNAWEEDGGAAIVMVASNAVSVERVLEITDSVPQLTLETVMINVTAKTVHRRALSDKILDFAVINPAYAATKNRYVYAAVIGFNALVGVVKLDLSLTNEAGRDCTVASRLYGPGCCGGEPFFVPNNSRGDEDDGYLITYLHDEVIQESKFLVMDARSPTLDIIASIKLPQRVPNDLHGLFVSESDLEKLL